MYAIDNLCKSFYDAIDITFLALSENLKILDKKEIRKRYLDNARSILAEIKSIFCMF